MAKPTQDPHELALKALGRKERTEAQLADWLRERGIEEPELGEVLTRLVEAGLLDDERFARRYAEDKRELAGWGPERIREALTARGVPREHVEAALASDGEPEQVRRAVAALRERGLRCWSEAERDRGLRLLARRGFPLEIGYEAVRVVERTSAEAA